MKKTTKALSELIAAIQEELPAPKKSIIGRTWYPIDNSYAVCISDPNISARLAGTCHSLAVECKIVSEPFEMEHTSLFGRRATNTFVFVHYDNNIYMVLFRDNWLNFNQNPEEKLASHRYHYEF